MRSVRCAWRAGVVALGTSVAACDWDVDALYCDPGEACWEERMDAGPSGADAALSPPPTDPYEAALQVFGADPACVECVARACETEARACEGDLDCGVEALCLARCGNDPWCRNGDCYGGHPQDAQPIAPVEDCARDRCTAECRAGEDWSCVGAYPLPEDTGPTRTIARLVVGATFAPVPEGIRARVCRFGDTECADPEHEA